MFANIFTKTIRDRYTGLSVAALSVAIALLGGMAVYNQIDVSFYYDLPQGILDLMGIPEGGDVAGLALGATYSLIGAFTLAGIAISMGSGAIAGEEHQGTLGLLLGNPKSRTRVVVSKAASMVVLLGLGSLVLWGAGLWVPSLLDVDMTGINVGALVFHMFVNSLFYGFLALAIGAWTGKGAMASGAAVAVMLVSYLAAGILPLVESLEGLAKIFPWYYFNGSTPVINGLDWGDMAILGGLAIALFYLAIVGLNRRDLRGRSTDVTLLDRLRANPKTAKIVERIAGSARVSRISIKTASEHQGLLVVTATIMFYLGLMMGPMWALLPESFQDVISQYPDALLGMIGSADMSTAEGFLQAQIFSLMGPATFVALTALMGSRAIAGEEQSRTMGLLMANPMRRSAIIVEKTLSMIAYSAVLGVATFLGVWFGNLLGGIEIPVGNLVATTSLLVLLGLVFGGVAMLLSAATGKTRVAAYGAIGVTLVAYFSFSFLPLAESLADYAKWSPFHFYLGSNPLTNGMAWGDAAVLAGIFAGLIALSIPLFQRRDLRG
ncbi:MAG: ABC transporter permease subunit [Acidimicrobiia bacterium]